jgi:hypothetical protein
VEFQDSTEIGNMIQISIAWVVWEQPKENSKRDLGNFEMNYVKCTKN